MKKIKNLVIATLAASILAACAAPAAPAPEEAPTGTGTITVGAKGFTEQHIMGNMLVQLLEYHTDLDVQYYPDMSTHILFSAIQNAHVDLYIEYTGTVYIALLGHEDILPAQETFEIAVAGLEEYNIMMLQPLGFNNTYALAVRQDTAEEFGLTSISDLVAVAPQLHFGGSIEVLERPDGIPGLRERYNMEFASETGLEGALVYHAIQNDQVQVMAAFSTDGLLMAHGLVVLEDDLAFFPPYHAAPVISAAAAAQHPQVVELLGMLEGIFTDDSMRELNYRVDVLHENPADVARDFLISVGLIS